MDLAQTFLENLWKCNAEYNALSDEEKERIKRHHDSKMQEIACESICANDNPANKSEVAE